jgi:hypothetical protein
MTLQRLSLSGLLLLIALFIGCDRAVPLEPVISAASNGGAGPTPTAPSGLNAVAVSESRVDVTWQDNSSNETGFEVHRSTTGPSGTFTLRTSTGASVRSFSDAGLAHSTSYCFKVRAFHVTGRQTNYSQFSSTACATTPAPPPPVATSGVDAIPAASSAIYVHWVDNSPNEDGFRVERSTDGGASWVTAGTSGPSSGYAPSFTDGGRTSEEQVCYRVLAFNGGGESLPSNTDCTTPPAGPTNLTATTVDPLTYTYELTWTDNSAVEDGYEVWMCETIQGYYSYCGFYDRLPANSTNYSLGLYAVGQYFVMAVKDGGYSDTSNPLTLP